MLKDMILAILEESGIEVSLRPSPLTWADDAFVCLLIPREDSEAVIEFTNKGDGKILITPWIKYFSGRSILLGRIRLNLADPNDFATLKKYLKENCFGEVKVEYSDSLHTQT